jgi:protein-S-isoprenylcysteine O-methyltransferase Ste14
MMLRVYLLAGLVLHKVVWEVLKTRRPARRVSAAMSLVKAAKIGMLIGIVVQTLAPEVLPISSEPAALRWTGLLLYTAGLALAITARIQLGRNWSDIETGSIARDHTIVDRGVYAIIRHPIYTGDLLLLAGLEMALNSWLVLAVAALALVVSWKAGKEEEHLASRIPAYRKYQSRTKRFIPFVA